MAPTAWHQCPMRQVSAVFALPGSELSHLLSRAGVPNESAAPWRTAKKAVECWAGTLIEQRLGPSLHLSGRGSSASGSFKRRRFPATRTCGGERVGHRPGGTYWCPAEAGAAGTMLCVLAAPVVTVTLDASAVIASTAALRDPVGVGATSLRDSGKKGEQRLESRAAAASK
ncbi:hypothetical protein KXD40_001156 [Peronospora effusa]|nr:hypothetical protein KXD40_001156 [Peronospora effusa]